MRFYFKKHTMKILKKNYKYFKKEKFKIKLKKLYYK